MKPASYKRLGWIAVLGAALAVVGVACANGLRGTCYNDIGVCVEWGRQAPLDPAHRAERLRTYVAQFERTVGVKITPFAEVIFIPDPGEMARPRHNGRAASGWFNTGTGLIHVLYAANLWDTALGHELLHREIYLQTGEADTEHQDPRWRLLCDGYYVCG